MKIQGNVYPETVTVEAYLSVPDMVEVRLRENVKRLSETMYEYDEYVTLMKDRPGLKEEIAANLSDWLVTLRTLEINENASILRDMREALALLEKYAVTAD